MGAWRDIAVHAHQRVHRYLSTCLHNREHGGSQCNPNWTPSWAPFLEASLSHVGPGCPQCPSWSRRWAGASTTPAQEPLDRLVVVCL